MTLPQIDITITDGVLTSSDLDPITRRAVAETIKQAELAIKPAAELSLVLCDDEMIQELNREWRQINKPTNVLSFPGEPTGMLLGDIIISVETTKRESDLENKTFEDHFSHLVIHGFLHLFGYDHETDQEADHMESLETKILNELGIADPYHDGSLK